MIPLLLFKRTPGSVWSPGIGDGLGERSGRPRIRCPKCAWEPGRGDLWMCFCLQAWHTFDTGGVCPSCDQRHVETQCLQCDDWSRHLDWYVSDDRDKDAER